MYEPKGRTVFPGSPESGTVFDTGISFGPGTIVEPGARIYDNVSVGSGCIIGANAVIHSDVTIGDRSIIGELTYLGGLNRIGRHTTIHAQCHVTHGMSIGSRCFVGPCMMSLNTPDIGPVGSKFGHPNTTHMPRRNPAIMDGCRIGGGVSIMPGVVVGADALVDAGAFLARDVPADAHIRRGKMSATRA